MRIVPRLWRLQQRLKKPYVHIHSGAQPAWSLPDVQHALRLRQKWVGRVYDGKRSERAQELAALCVRQELTARLVLPSHVCQGNVTAAAARTCEPSPLNGAAYVRLLQRWVSAGVEMGVRSECTCTGYKQQRSNPSAIIACNALSSRERRRQAHRVARKSQSEAWRAVR